MDILVPVAMFSPCLAAPAREGHLDQVFHLFAYLEQCGRSTVLFDDSCPQFDESRFAKCEWAEFCPGAHEPVPPNAPELRGRSITISFFVDADHGCRVRRRSHSGVLIYLNRAPVIWLSERQNTVESSTFGSEFIAMTQAVESMEGLRCKLGVMGVEVDGPTNVSSVTTRLQSATLLAPNPL